LNWQKILSQGFTSATELLKFLELPVESANILAEQQFSSRIPLGFAQRMRKGNPFDPLLLQVLAVDQELDVVAGYTTDPVHESQTNVMRGLIHKYHGRVLLTLTGACAINCRYCFRRHFPYQENNPGRNGWKEVADYIAKDSSISEVILSGGDPLLAADAVLSEVLQLIEAIPHVHTVRIHTRFPVVLPERINATLIELLKASRLHKVIVLHCNHAQELDQQVQTACIDLKEAGCHLLNQSVLLSGVNDNAQTLAELSQALFSFGVLPYYLHVMDKVRGAAHFDMAFTKTQQIYQELQTLLPGYLVPRLVREEPGKLSKTQLF
jgi:EF-P beta-lysylation protein EpmB